MPQVTLLDLKSYYDVRCATMEPLPPDYTTPLQRDELTPEALEVFNTGPDSFQLLVLGLKVSGNVADPKRILELGLRYVILDAQRRSILSRREEWSLDVAQS